MIRALLLIFFLPLFAFSQPVIETRPRHFFAEMGGFYASSKQTPFWLRTNQYGIVPNQLPYATVRAGVRQDYRYSPLTDITSPLRRDRFGIGYGFEVVSNLDAQTKKSTFLIPEAYVKIRAGAFEFMAGRRREVVGLVDSTLSSGSYSWSGNALPLPRIQISMPHYTPIGFTKGLISFRGSFAHGWFGSQRKVQHYFLHQKSLYGRLGKPHWPVKFYAGFNHQAQWGGVTDQLPESIVKNGHFPASLQDYLFVTVGNSLGRLSNVDTTHYSKFDRENRVGNHLGTIDLGIEFSSRRTSVLLYHQSVYEDGSLYFLTNIEDGLTGIRFRNLKPASVGLRITGAVVELLYTKSQGGGVFDDGNKFRGKDNYFNHTQFQDGWSYFGRGIGTPFITPVADTRPNLSPYGFFSNNRVRAYHTGIQGNFARNCQFQFKFSYSENYGTYDFPFAETLRQFSSIMSLELPVNQRGLLVTFSAAADQGDLFENSTGVYAGIRKTWDYYKYRVRK